MAKITIKQARKLLGKEFNHKSDKEIQDLIDQLYLLSEITVDMVIKNNGSNSQPGVIDLLPRKGKQSSV